MDVGYLSRKWRATWAVVACVPLLSGCVTTIEERAADGTTITRQYYPWQDVPAESTAKQKPSEHLAVSYARVLETKGQTMEARSSYEQVLRQNPKSADALMGMARLDQLAGRSAAAEQNYTRAVNAEPNNPTALVALGNFYAENKRWNEAIGAMNQASQKSPDDREIRCKFATVLARAGQSREALTQFMQAVTPAEAHYNMAIIAHEHGDLTGAEENLVLSLTKNPHLRDAQIWLTEVRREKDAQIAAASGAVGNGYRNVAAGYNPSANQRAPLTTNPAPTGRTGLPTSLAPQSVEAPATRRAGVVARNVTFPRPSRYGYDRGSAQPAPAQPIPASAGHNPPAGFSQFSEEQWEQWRNQNGANAAAAPGYGQ